MRLFGPVLAVVSLGATLLGAPVAQADKRASIRAQEESFELFGTSFCYQESRPGLSCDVTFPTALPAQAMSVSPPQGDSVPRVKIFGVTFCARLEATGPACDVAWVPPQPAQPWRDMPEIRLASAGSFYY